MKQVDQYPRGTAYHEAGHAIVAWSFDVEVGTIHVMADDASGGLRPRQEAHCRSPCARTFQGEGEGLG
jgi:hypothetical protein